MYIVKHENLDMKKIADSGQVFRLNEIGKGKFELIAGDKLLLIEEASCRLALKETVSLQKVASCIC